MKGNGLVPVALSGQKPERHLAGTIVRPLMKSTVGALLLAITLAFANRSSAATLPDACGDDKTTLDVKVQRDQPGPAPPDASNAQIVFVEKFDNVGACLGCEVTTRVGVDGKWVGADHGTSYFALLPSRRVSITSASTGSPCRVS